MGNPVASSTQPYMPRSLRARSYHRQHRGRLRPERPGGRCGVRGRARCLREGRLAGCGQRGDRHGRGAAGDVAATEDGEYQRMREERLRIVLEFNRGPW
ncbi:MAG TPA: hypothetical protein VHJ17_23260 [Thermomonospora sp.]|nr:hypothetical protein [Thermomonospora sp.]